MRKRFAQSEYKFLMMLAVGTFDQKRNAREILENQSNSLLFSVIQTHFQNNYLISFPTG